jgi:hypothetical protein
VRKKLETDDRLGNPIGAAGFALNVTTILFLVSGVLSFKELPAYLPVATCCGVPFSLTGLVCSIVGCLRPGRPKLFSLLGTLLGGALVLVILPGLIIALKNNAQPH